MTSVHLLFACFPRFPRSSYRHAVPRSATRTDSAVLAGDDGASAAMPARCALESLRGEEEQTEKRYLNICRSVCRYYKTENMGSCQESRSRLTLFENCLISKAETGDCTIIKFQCFFNDLGNVVGLDSASLECRWPLPSAPVGALPRKQRRASCELF